MPVEKRLQRLREAGMDQVEVIAPDPAFLDQAPEAFVRRMVEDFAPRAWVEGPDFRFGRGRAGDIERLRALGTREGFQVETVETADVPLADHVRVPVSSSLVRWLLAQGRVGEAAVALGQGFELTAPVVTGQRRGRTLGFPTVNLDEASLEGFAVPAEGVYAGLARLPAGKTWPAAISVGRHATFGAGACRVEAHLPGFEGDLYGQRIDLSPRRYLRDQGRFPGPAALAEQLARDVARTRWLFEHGMLAAAEVIPMPEGVS